jgi:hypothetical protein
MTGIYLTQKGKQEIESKIAERRKYSPIETEDDWYENGELNVYKEILASATIIPVEESWEHGSKFTNVKYKHGVIIQPKK